MAYVVPGSFRSESFAAATSATLTEWPDHATGDVLIVVATQDGGSGVLSTATAGWNLIGTRTGTPAGGAFQQLFYKKAASGAEAAPQIDSTVTEELLLLAFVVRDVDGTTQIDNVSVQTDWNNVASATSASLTPTVDDCLVIFSWGSDGSTNYRCDLDQAVMIGQDQGSFNFTPSAGVCSRQQQTAGAITALMNFSTATEGGTSWVISIKNATGGKRSPDVRMTSAPVKFYGNFGVAVGTTTILAPESASGKFAGGFTAATLDSVAVTAVDPTVSTSASSLNIGGIGTATSMSNAENTAGKWVGGWHTISSTDMTGQIFSGEISYSHAPSTGRVGAKGMLVGFTDGTNYELFRVINKTKGWSALNGYRYFIYPGQTTPTYSRGTLAWSAITGIAYMWHRQGSSGTAELMSVQNAHLLSSMILTGGIASNPVTPGDFFLTTEKDWVIDLSRLQGSAQTLAFIPIQIGNGGTDTTIFEAAPTEFPRAWSATPTSNWQTLWNIPASYAGVTVYAGASDTMDFSASTLKTDTLQPFTLHASTSTGATYSFVGTSFIGWDVTWKTGVACTSATFKACAPIDFKGTSITTVTITDTLAGAAEAAAIWDANGATLDGVEIDVTGTSAGYHIELGASVTGITLTDVTFTGTPGTDKVHVLATTGTTTITINGTTTLVAGDVTSAGATVSIVSSPVIQTCTVTNIPTGSRLQIYDTEASSELFNGTASAGNVVWTGSTAVWTDPAAAVSTRTMRLRIAYSAAATANDFIDVTLAQQGTTSGIETSSYNVNAVVDDVYVANAIDGSGVTGITITVGPSRVNINLAGGAVTWPSIYAYQVYWQFTATGIAQETAFIEAKDTANYLLTDFDIKNTHANPLTLTGGWGRDSVTLTVAGCIDSAGSTGNIFAAPDHVVAYATGSGLTAGQAAELTAAASSASTAATQASAVATQVGTAGAGLTAIGDTRIANLDATVSSRSTYAGGAVASVTGAVGSVTGLTASDVGAIKAKTDNLPAAPAATGDVPSAVANATQVRTELTAELTRLTKLANLSAIDENLVVTPTTRVAGALTQTITTVGDTTTVTTP